MPSASEVRSALWRARKQVRHLEDSACHGPWTVSSCVGSAPKREPQTKVSGETTSGSGAALEEAHCDADHQHYMNLYFRTARPQLLLVVRLESRLSSPVLGMGLSRNDAVVVRGHFRLVGTFAQHLRSLSWASALWTTHRLTSKMQFSRNASVGVW